jgi:hypothetical protein
VLYDGLAPHVALVIVVDPNRKDHRKANFVGEVFRFSPLCIDEGSFCSMPNRERGTVAVTRQAARATNPQVLQEQSKHMQVGGWRLAKVYVPLMARQRLQLCRVFCCAGPSAGHPADDKSARQGEEGRNDALHFFPCHFFTLWRSEVLVRQRNGNAAKRKDAMDKTSNRAGATPLFRLSAAQKVRGVAPARHADRVR